MQTPSKFSCSLPRQAVVSSALANPADLKDHRHYGQPTVDTELVVNCGVLPQNHLTTTSWIFAQESDKLPGQAIDRRQQEQTAFYPRQQSFLDSKQSQQRGTPKKNLEVCFLH